jgi:peptidoglycan hydrolase-like protein with peptidoglycan-binding domain
MAENGRLGADELSPIPGGELRNDAARGWNAPGGPADAGLVPTGSMSSYRTYDEQVYLYGVYQRGGNLAAVPGTSNHGWGVAIDLPSSWMWQWMGAHGAAFGWKKTEAFSEPWHWNFVGGVKLPPIFKALQRGDHGKRVKRYSRRLAYILRSKADRKREHADRKHYILKPRRKFDVGLERAVKLFQRDHGLTDDGVIGPKTASLIDATFRRQWAERSN